jgi:hypothetical protein
MRYPRLFTAVSILLLTACSGNDVKDTLGLTRESPDEYRVVTRPPLSVPPEFNLRPPAAPGEMPASQATDKQAQSLITGKPIEDSNTFKLQAPDAKTAIAKPSDVPAAKTTPEANFLQKAGAPEADPNVRAAIEKDKARAAVPAEEESNWWDPTSLWSSTKKEPMVDAKEEADRLKKNKEEGKPVTEGDTPETTGRDTGVLGRILGY